MKDTDKRMKIIWHGLPIVSLLLWGAFCVTNNLWYDEGYSAAMVRLPWLRMFYTTAVDAHSPFYYVVLKIVYILCGSTGNFQCLKSVSLLFVFGYMLLGKYYVSKLFNRSISVYYMLSSMLIPIMTVQSGNVRMYTFSLFFMTLLGLLAYDIYLKESRKKWVLFCLTSICVVYCHTFSMIMAFFIYMMLLVIYFTKKDYSRLKKTFISGIIVAVAFLPWLIITFMQMVLRVGGHSKTGGFRADIFSIVDYIREWFSALETPIDGVAIAGILIAVLLIVLAVKKMIREKKYAPIVGLAALILTVLTGWGISMTVNNCFMGRYVYPGFGFLMLVYAFGLDALKKNAYRYAVICAMFICFCLQYYSEIRLDYDDGLEEYIEYVEQNVGEEGAIIVPNEHPLYMSIYKPEYRYFIYEYLPSKIPFPNTEALTDYWQLDDVEGAIWYLCLKGDTPEKLSDKYDYELMNEIHFMYYDYTFYKLTAKW